MPVNKLREYLDRNGIKYLTISHSPAFTAQEIAAKAHVPGHEMAKTVMLNVDGKLAMAVLPASYQVDLDSIREGTGAKYVELATEEEFQNQFPDCEVGAMPPFGNLYGLDVFVARKLAEDEEICFNAGTHTELIRMAYSDFERLVKPMVMKFSVQYAMF